MTQPISNPIYIDPTRIKPMVNYPNPNQKPKEKKGKYPFKFGGIKNKNAPPPPPKDNCCFVGVVVC